MILFVICTLDFISLQPPPNSFEVVKTMNDFGRNIASMLKVERKKRRRRKEVMPISSAGIGQFFPLLFFGEAIIILLVCTIVTMWLCDFYCDYVCTMSISVSDVSGSRAIFGKIIHLCMFLLTAQRPLSLKVVSRYDYLNSSVSLSCLVGVTDLPGDPENLQGVDHN